MDWETFLETESKSLQVSAEFLQQLGLESFKLDAARLCGSRSAGLATSKECPSLPWVRGFLNGASARACLQAALLVGGAAHSLSPQRCGAADTHTLLEECSRALTGDVSGEELLGFALKIGSGWTHYHTPKLALRQLGLAVASQLGATEAIRHATGFDSKPGYSWRDATESCLLGIQHAFEAEEFAAILGLSVRASLEGALKQGEPRD